jgi:AcrR family transcriptional regulator
MPKIIENLKDRLLQELEQMFVEGAEDISLRGLARRANVAVGTIYNYFPDKDDLIKALFQREWDSVVADIRRTLGEEGDRLPSTGQGTSIDGDPSAGIEKIVTAVYANAERVAGRMFRHRRLFHSFGHRGGHRGGHRHTPPYPFRSEGWSWLAEGFEPVWDLVLPERRFDSRRLTVMLVASVHRLITIYPQDREANIRFVTDLIVNGVTTFET